MEKPETQEHALPTTLGFTLVFGALLAIGWFALFFLLRSRW
jgi:hypothetical protein